MTDYAATAFGRAILLQSEIFQLEAKRQGMGKQSGDDVELRQRQEALDDALSLRQIEIETEVKRTSTLIGQVATLEGKIRDLEEELRVVSLEKGEMGDLLRSSELVAQACGQEIFSKDSTISGLRNSLANADSAIIRLKAEIRRLQSLTPKPNK
jgi:archaellum component FlaC